VQCGVWITGAAGWFEATMWLLGAGLILAGLAAIAGLTDVLGDARIRISARRGGTPAATCSPW